MKAIIWKHEKGFEPVFFDVNTLGDLLNALCEYSYPPMQINIEDDEHGDPRLGIEIFDGVGSVDAWVEEMTNPHRFDHFRKPINEMSYGELRKMETMTLTQPRTREERHACLDARNYLREKPPKFEKPRLAEERWRNAYKPKSVPESS